MISPDISDLIGIPFVDGGRDTDGCDCWGLTRLVFERFGLIIPDYKIACGSVRSINRAVDDSRIQWCRIEKPAAPCLVVMRTAPRMPRCCNHLGTYIGHRKLLHTLQARNSHLIDIDDPYFSTCIEGFYALKGSV